MNEIRIFEVTLKGNAILRPAAGEHFTCARIVAPIIGEVWTDGTNHYCTTCAAWLDRAKFGTRAAHMGKTMMTIVGIQSEISY